jgi:hypothetical protein
MRKTAPLTGVAGLLLMTAPAFAQDGTAPQTPPAPAEAAPPAAEQPQNLTLQPGSDVKGSDGAVLGQLEGARNTPAGQELTVRGPDGQLRGVPVSSGVRQEGEGVAVGWTSAQFASAPSINDTASEVDEPAAAPMPDEPNASPATPATPATPAVPAEPGEFPAKPGEPAQPAKPAQPASPTPGEGEEAPPPTEPEA